MNPSGLTRRAAVAATLIAGLFPRKPYAAGPLARLVRHDEPVPVADAPFVRADGSEARLAEFRGKGIVLNLWATWCAPCVAEMPALKHLADAVRKEGIMVMPLSSDRGGAPVVRDFYRKHGLDGLDVWLDPRGSAARAWGARGLPTTLLIGRDGMERARIEGDAAWGTPEAVAQVREILG